MSTWKDDLSSRERVREIVTTVTDPVSVNWVAEQADVGWETAKKELQQLADRGELRAIEQDDNTRYVPDFTRLYTERIRELAVDFSRDDLREEVVAAKDEIQELRDEFDVEDRDELEQSLGDEQLSPDETRYRQQALRQWEELADDLRLLQHALTLYDDIHDADPYVDPSGDTGDSATDATETLA